MSAHRDEADLRRTSRRAWSALGVAASLVVVVIVVGSLTEPEPPRSPGTSPAAGPSESSPGASQTASPTPSPGGPDQTPAAPILTAGGIRYAFPVGGTVSYARQHHDYPATDIIARCGSPVRAAHSGVVLEVSRTDSFDPVTDDGAARGGLFVSVLGDDGVRYYGSHLSRVAAGITAGTRVRVGQTLGAVGDSGRAGTCHLHFGVSPPCAKVGDWWIRRGVLWPWSYLDSWRNGDQVSPAAEASAWHRAHGCPTAP